MKNYWKEDNPMNSYMVYYNDGEENSIQCHDLKEMIKYYKEIKGIYGEEWSSFLATFKFDDSNERILQGNEIIVTMNDLGYQIESYCPQRSLNHRRVKTHYRYSAEYNRLLEWTMETLVRHGNSEEYGNILPYKKEVIKDEINQETD
jgi:hypothetical protein